MTHGGGGSPTLDEVARVAGVSRATASRAINGGSKVSPQAQRAVDDAVRRLGYSPNAAARSLATRRSDSVALILPESDEMVFSDPFFGRMLHVVSRTLTRLDLLMVPLIAERGEQEERMLRFLRGRHVDGAIVASHHRDDALADHLADMGLPSVLIGRPWTGEERVTYVDSDNIGASRQATRVLVQRGCTRIGTIAGPSDMFAGHDRLEGWRQELAAAGLPAHAVVEGDFTEDGGTRACTTLLDLHPDLDGIFVASDLMAAGALRVLNARRRRVPEDVAVVGYDDLGTAERTEPPLTTLRNPIGDMAAEACRLLVEDMESSTKGAPRRVVFVPELVRRASA
ncbi:transcriptional regulator, LacI family [Nocardioides terrae]|uniref:Transcriptional regulator, LacI family n=1 Tax=Nocardioides terrae TaxID=574651 RepID=A0A1I1F4Q0_9ACTN|nr:LacI family DNA-binding transcriptional regulator [Nocardioides terrae]SFB94257.1 transcriptional regulator, LacI family [Nocardioides terrae]